MRERPAWARRGTRLKRTLHFLMTGVVALALGCGAPSSSIPGEPEGCWASNRPSLDTFELAYDESGATLFRPERSGSLPINEWHVIGSTDSLRINYGYGGFAGETVRALLVTDSLIGTSVPFTDLVGGPPAPPMEFRAVRIDCPPRAGVSFRWRSRTHRPSTHAQLGGSP